MTQHLIYCIQNYSTLFEGLSLPLYLFAYATADTIYCFAYICIVLAVCALSVELMKISVRALWQILPVLLWP